MDGRTWTLSLFTFLRSWNGTYAMDDKFRNISNLVQELVSINRNIMQLGFQSSYFHDIFIINGSHDWTGEISLYIISQITSNFISNCESLKYISILLQGTFYMYAVIAFIGFVIFYGILPETKGKTLEEMEELFTSWF